jgi:hypothetical protein
MQPNTVNAAHGKVLVFDSVMRVAYGERVALLRGRATTASPEDVRTGFVIFMRRGHQWAAPHDTEPFEVTDLRAVVNMLRCNTHGHDLRLAFDFAE